MEVKQKQRSQVKQEEGTVAADELRRKPTSEFQLFDASVFKTHTYGALGLCGICKKLPAEFMRSHPKVGGTKGLSYYPFCSRCKQKQTEAITSAQVRESTQAASEQKG